MAGYQKKANADQSSQRPARVLKREQRVESFLLNILVFVAVLRRMNDGFDSE